MKLETERLVLRPWEEPDRHDLIAVQCDPEVRRFFPNVPSPQQVSEDFDAALQRTRDNGFHFGSARLKQDNTFVGLIGLGLVPDDVRETVPSHPQVEIGWVFAKRFWGQSLAPEGAAAWLSYAWSIGLPEVVAFTAAINLPSQRVMTKIGMAYEPADDFMHPRVNEGHSLRPHVLYRIASPDGPQ